MKLRESLADLKPYIAGKLKEGAIKLASNENVLGPSPKAMAAVRNFISEMYLYPDSNCEKIKEKIASKWNVAPDNIIMGNGSDEILLFIAGAYMEKGRNAVTSEATFSEYTFAVKLFNGAVKYAPMKDCRFQLDKIGELVDQNTHIVFLCNPNNPTGTYFTGTELEAFLKKIPDDVLVVLDEAYCEYVTARDFPESLKLLKDHKNLMVLKTFSKMYGLAGLRVGYGIADAGIINDLMKTKEPFNVNAVAQVAAAAAIEDEDFVQKTREMNEKGKAYLYEQFTGMNLPFWKTESNFIFLRTGVECMKAFQKLMDTGVTIRPMKLLGFEDAIRVTIGTQEDNELFIRLLKKLLGK